MPIILPEPGKPISQREINPWRLMLYGPRKLGKTSFLNELPHDRSLIIDTEKGTDALPKSMSVQVNSVNELYEARDGIIKMAMGMPKNKDGKVPFPYTWICLDTITTLEEMVERHATHLYNISVEKGHEGKDARPVESVEDLAWGAGYGKIRRGVIKALNDIAKVCRYVIIVAHLKETELAKAGATVLSKDISLQGKLKDIICSRVDAIGYMFWEKKELMISFTAMDKAGSRYAHLKNVIIPADWSRIYLNEGLESKPYVAV
jgi:hypothetical protein